MADDFETSALGYFGANELFVRTMSCPDHEPITPDDLAHASALAEKAITSTNSARTAVWRSFTCWRSPSSSSQASSRTNCEGRSHEEQTRQGKREARSVQAPGARRARQDDGRPLRARIVRDDLREPLQRRQRAHGDVRLEGAAPRVRRHTGRDLAGDVLARPAQRPHPQPEQPVGRGGDDRGAVGALAC